MYFDKISLEINKVKIIYSVKKRHKEDSMWMFQFFDIIFPIVFALVLGMIIFTLVQGIMTWHKNNQSPRLTVEATVVAKRMNVEHHNHHNATDATGAQGHHTLTSTYYYVTFQVESGDRMEFHVSGSEYGMLVEGDKGKLMFQGTRYLSFDRENRV